MPYIPPDNRPLIDEHVNALADDIADSLAATQETASVSCAYREAFSAIADTIAALETGPECSVATAAERVAAAVVEAARGYGQQGGWLGELNYALTRLIQAVPLAMKRRGAWPDYLRYWLFAETVGALTRAAYDVHSRFADDYIGNGLAGVFEDVKDEYKRRVNTSYEAAQIRKSGDCYDMVPYHTQLVETEIDGTRGFVEVMLDYHAPECEESPAPVSVAYQSAALPASGKKG